MRDLTIATACGTAITAVATLLTDPIPATIGCLRTVAWIAVAAACALGLILTTLGGRQCLIRARRRDCLT